ncbi:DUF2407 C-terminal domain-containing protein [Bisporella sp. PMI_857]|nr:DUF2407 C-terminal domain-containing protein [Bisporella sp. PMI_857]
MAANNISGPNGHLPITIRFTTSTADLLLDIEEPEETTVIALKHLIRSKLDHSTSKHHFRLIHSGKLLKDDDILASVLKIPSPLPPVSDPKGKGKAIEVPPARVYINCAIGDVLTSAELSTEALAAAESRKKSSKDRKSKNSSKNVPPLSTTTPAPQGFDRLLSGGFTPAEVNQLRLQFLSIQSSIHTEATMPSPATLRRMEDAWIDNNAGNSGLGTEEGGFDFGDDGLGGGALDDLLYGNIIGFLWPLGCVGWAMREGGGIWSKRRQIAVFTGFLLSLTFGVLRVMS